MKPWHIYPRRGYICNNRSSVAAACNTRASWPRAAVSCSPSGNEPAMGIGIDTAGVPSAVQGEFIVELPANEPTRCRTGSGRNKDDGRFLVQLVDAQRARGDERQRFGVLIRRDRQSFANELAHVFHWVAVFRVACLHRHHGARVRFSQGSGDAFDRSVQTSFRTNSPAITHLRSDR
jgi:hypothetical protein